MPCQQMYVIGRPKLIKVVMEVRLYRFCDNFSNVSLIAKLTKNRAFLHIVFPLWAFKKPEICHYFILYFILSFLEAPFLFLWLEFCCRFLCILSYYFLFVSASTDYMTSSLINQGTSGTYLLSSYFILKSKTKFVILYFFVPYSDSKIQY